VRNSIKADVGSVTGANHFEQELEALMGGKSGGRSTSYLLRGSGTGEHLAVLEALNLPISLIDRQYTYTWVNSCYSAAHGKSQEEIVGRKVPALWGQENFVGAIKSSLDQCFEGVEVRDEAWIDFPALGPRYCEVVYSPLRPDSKRVASVAVITYDIDDRKKMESQLKAHEEHLERLVEERTEELRKSERTYRNIFENATEGIFQITPEGHFISANPALACIYGYDSPEDFVTRVVDVGELHIEPEQRREFIELLHKEGHVRNFEFKMHRKNGSVTWTSVNARVVRDETGAVTYHEGTVQDISERKQAEEDILIQRDLSLKLAGMSSLEDALPLCLDTAMKVAHMESGGIYVKNRQTGGLELACSTGQPEEFEGKLSLTKPRSPAHALVMAGKPLYLSLHEEGAHPFRTELPGGGPLFIAILPVLHAGDVIACFNLSSRILNSIPLYVRTTLELIAMQLGAIFARIQTEHELREREEHFSLIFQSNPGAMLLTTMDGHIVDFNRNFLKTTGYQGEEVLGRTTAELGLWLSKKKREKKVKEVRELGSIHDYETSIRMKSGELRDILVSIELITQREDRFLLTMFQDVTERKRAEAQLLIQRNLALKLAATSSPDKALSLCLETAIQASGMDCGAIHLKNPDTDDLEMAVQIGLSEKLVDRFSVLKAHSEIWSLVTRRKNVTFSLVEHVTEAVKPYILGEGVRSAVMMPVVYKGQVIASVNLGSREVDPARNPGWPTLELIAGQLGSIIIRIRAEQELQNDIEKRKIVEKALEAKSRSLEEANTALKVLLKHRDEDKLELEEKVVSNVKQLVLPYVQKLKKGKLEPSQQIAVDFVEANLNEILSPFLNNLRCFNFTPRQLEIIALIKEGRTTKEIAEFLHVSTEDIDMHRFLLRKKLGLNKEKTNLRSYLLSLA
jgi:PAS domain S-box-containing protein